MGSTWRVMATFLVLALALGLLSACGGGGSKSERTSTSSGVSSSDSAAVQSPPTSGGEAAPAATTASGTAASVASDWDRKIIRNADLSLQVTNVESTLAAIRSLVDGVDGVVFASSTSYTGDQQNATMTLDVPADQFDQVVTSLRSMTGVKKVVSESITSQDVTDDYVDLQSELTSLKATQARLTTLMSKATDLQDILPIEDELSKVEGEIDQTTGRINYLDKKTSFSRITLTLAPVEALSEQTNNGGFDLGQSVHQAWKSSLDFTGGVVTALVKVGVFLWWFWPIAVICGAVTVVRRQRRRSAATTIQTGA